MVDVVRSGRLHTTCSQCSKPIVVLVTPGKATRTKCLQCLMQGCVVPSVIDAEPLQ